MKISIFSIFLILVLFTKSGLAQNIWEPTNGPSGLDLSTSVVVNNEKVIAVSARKSGIYFSKDHGSSWEKISKGLERSDSYAYSMAVGPDGSFYAIIDEYLYRLEKNSNEWHKANDEFWGGYVVTVNMLGDVYLVFGPYPGEMAYSNDKGKTINRIWLNQNWHGIRDMVFKGNGNNFLTVGEGGTEYLYKMNDDGSNLSFIDSAAFGLLNLIWHPSGLLFYYNEGKGLFKIDHQNQLIKINSFDFGFNINKVSIRPDGRMVAYDHDTDYESDEYGENWIQKNTSLHKGISRYGDILFIDNEVFSMSNDCYDLIKSTDDGKTWTTFDIFFTNSYMNSIWIDKMGILFSNTCQFDEYSYSIDKGENWTFINNATESGNTDLVSTSTSKLFTLSGSELYKSDDSGLSWSKVNVTGNEDFYKLLGNGDKIICALGIDEKYLSKDGGNNWIKMPDAPNKFIWASKFITHLDSIAFFILDDIVDTIFIFDIVNNVWKETFSGFNSVDAFHISNKGKFYISGFSKNETGLFISSNQLENIEHISDTGFISIVSDVNGVLYGLVDNNICLNSIDDGKNWKEMISGLPLDREASTLALDDDQYLYVGLGNDVVYKTIKPVNKIADNTEVKINALVVIQPNPVSNKLTITISDKNISSGHYKIIDLNGTEKLKGDFQSNQFTIDCSSLANGMAFIQILDKNNNFHSIEKMVVCH